jgi:hypothetical protein
VVDGVNIEGTLSNMCQVCQEGRLNYHITHRVRVKRPLERIHTDVVGPVSPIGYDGSRYILTLVDDYTHFHVNYVVKNKVKVVNCIKNYEAAVTARFSVKVCKFRCDSGGEYMINELKEFFAEKGIQFEYMIHIHQP